MTLDGHASPLMRRFDYLVRRVGGRWEVAFGPGGSQFVYESRHEAVQVARGAARLHWETRHEPSGVVLVDDDGDARLVADYGM